MAMSNAERQRKYRQNRDKDPDKRMKYLQESKERYKKDRISGKNKSIQDMTSRERRHMRKKWRHQKRKDRERVKSMLNTLKRAMTPPSTPEHVPDVSRQKKAQIKKESRNKAKCYRENDKLKVEIENLNRKVRMYQKRLQRLENKAKKDKTDSPRTKTRKLLRNLSSSQAKRCIFMFNVVTEQLRQKYKEKRKKDKANFAKILSGHVIKKYKVQTETQNILGIKTNMSRKPRIGYYSLTKRVCEKVKDFYIRNDNSRLVSGKRQTKTVRKNRKQRRVLMHSLKTLYTKFLSEGIIKLSYTQFCKLRPFYVVFPRTSDRDTCVCKLCDNTQLMAEALKNAKAIQSDDIGTLIGKRVCDTRNKNCMYRDCESCNSKKFEVNEDALDNDVMWFEWKTKKEKRCIKQGGREVEKFVTLTVREEMNGKVDSLLDKFDNQVDRYMKHMYRFNSQYYYYKSRTENLLDNECIINIDFSENYVCKHAREIHALHFGASKKQLTLHTGVVHIKHKSPKTFCSVSDSLEHGPPAVWCHLKEILTDIRSENPEISSIEIFSDGPATQYKQKGNFFLTSVKANDIGFSNVKWSFFEAGHGKGIPDAVGGSVKNYADKQVKYGKDITSAKDFYNLLSDATKTLMYYVPEIEITNELESLKKVPLKAVPGTLHVHQFCVLNPGEIGYRDLSCKCLFENEHEEHLYKKAYVTDKSYFFKEKAGLNEQKGNIENVTDSTSKTKKPYRKRKQSEKPETKGKRKRKDCSNDYSKMLENLNKCKTFAELKSQCKSLELSELNTDPRAVSLFSNKLDVDFDAFPDIPEDIPDRRELYPCEVLADGNCLPSCGSVYAHGKNTESSELRVRIIHELVMNEDCYLSNCYLTQGVNESQKDSNLPLRYSQYSEFYIPGVQLNSDLIRKIYRQEVFSITEDRSFMGIWQLFALASILKVPLYSVYPMKGNINVRKDLHRLILPRQNQSVENIPVYILWTNTREDVTTEHWVPNHFVPLIPFDSDVSIVSMAPQTLNKACVQEELEADNTSESFKSGCTKNEIDAEMICNNQFETNKTKGVTNEHETEDQTIIRGENISSVESEAAKISMEYDPSLDINNNIVEKTEDTEKVSSISVTDLNQLIGKYVFLRYNNKPYPGMILDVEGTDVQISCLHKIGRKTENCFFWPKKIKDIFWYDYQDLICTIPEPVAHEKSGHFKVDDSVWKSVLDKSTD